MAVKSTLPIRFSDVSAEFGRNTNMRLSDYLRGGGLVPDVPANSGVPTSLPIRLDDLLGATATIPDVIVNFSGSYSYDANSASAVSYGFIVQPNGEIHFTRTTVSGGGSQATTTGYLAQWAAEAPIQNVQGADFEVYFSGHGPSWNGDAFGVWHSLNESRTITISSGSNSCGISVREKSNHNNAETQAFQLSNSG